MRRRDAPQPYLLALITGCTVAAIWGRRSLPRTRLSPALTGGASSYPGVVAMPGWLAIVLSMLALGIVLTLALAWITNHPD